MQGKATIARHPIHPPVVSVAIGCFAGAAISDITSIWIDHGFLAVMSTWLIGFGLGAAIVAAFFGFVDYLSAPMTAAAKAVASWHALLNVALVVVFGTALAMRAQTPSSTGGYVLTAAGLVILGVSGWLGGSLVSQHMVGISERDSAAPRQAADDPLSEERMISSRIGSRREDPVRRA